MNITITLTPEQAAQFEALKLAYCDETQVATFAQVFWPNATTTQLQFRFVPVQYGKPIRDLLQLPGFSHVPKVTV